MRITLDQAEITDAVKAYAQTMINIATGQEIEIDFIAGRGDNGLSATLSISTPKAVLGVSKPGPRTMEDQSARDQKIVDRLTTSPKIIPAVVSPTAFPNFTVAPEAREEPEAEAVDVAEVEAVEINETSVAADEEAVDAPAPVEPPKARGRSIFSTLDKTASA